MSAYEDATKVSKESVDTAMKSLSAVTKGLQQIATETTDFSKRSYEQSTSMFQELVQSKTMEKAMEIQKEYAKTAYQGWLSQATKMGEIYAGIAKEAYKPFDTAVSSLGLKKAA